MKNKSVKMPEILIHRINELALKEGRKFSAMARILIERQIKQPQDDDNAQRK